MAKKSATSTAKNFKGFAVKVESVEIKQTSSNKKPKKMKGKISPPLEEQDDLSQWIEIARKEEFEAKMTFNSLKRELKAIVDKKYDEQSKYQLARKILYEAILPMETISYVEWYDNDLINREKIREAGEILFEAEGMQGMRDTLLWSFIPETCHGFIDKCWHGIGDWRA